MGLGCLAWVVWCGLFGPGMFGVGCLGLGYFVLGYLGRLPSRCEVAVGDLPIAHDRQHRAVGIHMLAPIEQYHAEHATDADLAAERALMQKDLAALAAAQGVQPPPAAPGSVVCQGEEPQGEEPQAQGKAGAKQPAAKMGRLH